MVAALGRAAVDGQRHYVVKLDAWAALDLPLLAEAFPDTAFVFLYRDPVEVLVSQAGHRGYHMLPFTLDPARLGLTAQQVASLSPDDYGAAVLGRITEAAVTAARAGRLLLVEYPELPAAVGDRIAPHLGMPLGAAEAAAMSAVTGMHAKNQVSAFVDDSATKQRAAPPQLRDAAERWAMPAYQELRELRRRQQRDDGGVPGTASGRPA